MNEKAKRDRILTILLPAALGGIMLVLLQTQVIHWIFDLKVIQLPLPSQIGQALAENQGQILLDAWVTLLPVVTGMALGGLLGYGLAMLVTIFPQGGYGGLILMTALNSVPVVALATVMNRWFSGAFAAKTAVVVILTMGIMSINAFRGLNDLKPYTQDLMRSYGAHRWQVMRKLRLPGSLPDAFTALKINVATAMMGTIIGEFFASETAGLGFMIKYCLKVGNQKAQGWAYITAAAVLSLILYGILCVIEKRVLVWHVSTERK
ncbi:ABC transporter permease subunit [bacterium 210820-DFI.6.37]|nr:ABC transporter permease subunit [bacterium 210820-DFI.6.37]